MHTIDRFRDDLATFEEAAVALGGSRRLVEDAVKRGDLVRVVLGRRCVRVTRASVVAYRAARDAAAS